MSWTTQFCFCAAAAYLWIRIQLWKSENSVSRVSAQTRLSPDKGFQEDMLAVLRLSTQLCLHYDQLLLSVDHINPVTHSLSGSLPVLFSRPRRAEPFLCSGGFAGRLAADRIAFAGRWPAGIFVMFWLVMVGVFRPVDRTQKTSKTIAASPSGLPLRLRQLQLLNGLKTAVRTGSFMRSVYQLQESLYDQLVLL
ncbi:hypothetical protein GOODEAATRI_019907 [Goodea atripinnis]|uniref:Uncharacterized protein n=1 Tax=Goodea atripinnis TaxID=208336 RepID=A0ABV0NLQ9_9TELE